MERPLSDAERSRRVAEIRRRGELEADRMLRVHDGDAVAAAGDANQRVLRMMHGGSRLALAAARSARALIEARI